MKRAGIRLYPQSHSLTQAVSGRLNARNVAGHEILGCCYLIGGPGLIWRWARRIALILITAFVGLYFGDWAVYKMRGSPQGSVTVTRTLVVPLKGNKQEYDYLGTSDEPCSISIFSQGGESPCWQLRRNQKQDTKL